MLAITKVCVVLIFTSQLILWNDCSYKISVVFFVVTRLISDIDVYIYIHSLNFLAPPMTIFL